MTKRARITLLVIASILFSTTFIYSADEDVEFYVYPNPILGENNIFAYINITGDEATYEMDLRLYDIKFNLVKEYGGERTITSGLHMRVQLGSFGTDGKGSKINHGIYFFYLRISGADIDCEKIYKVSYYSDED